jgi:hypothetical protein
MGTPQTLITACGLLDDGEGSTGNTGSNSGTGGVAGAGAQSGVSLGGATLTLTTSCTLDADAGAVFSDEAFSLDQPWPPFQILRKRSSE